MQVDRDRRLERPDVPDRARAPERDAVESGAAGRLGSLRRAVREGTYRRDSRAVAFSFLLREFLADEM